jgi:hypothetical protein
MGAAVAMALLSACQRELPLEVDAPAPAATHLGCLGGEFPYIYPPDHACPIPEDPNVQIDLSCQCAPAIVGDLISGTGSTVVDFPSTSTTPWGKYVFNYGFQGQGQAYGFSLSLPAGWVVDDYYLYRGDCGNLSYAGGYPVVTGAWQYNDVVPNSDCVIENGNLLPSGCNCVALKANIFRSNFVGNPVSGSQRSIYLYAPLSNTDDNVQTICFSGCPPPPPVETVVTVGTCERCDSENIVTFYDCDRMTVSSCKNIARVRVVYTDCTFQQFNGVGSSMNHTAPSGKEISHIFVKSGCNGGGLGRRIDSPCVEPACN